MAGLVVKTSNVASLADNMNAAVEGFLSYCSAKNLSDNTLIYYRYRLGAFLQYLSENAPGSTPGNITPQIIRAFAAYESKHTSPATANHSITTLKAFFNYLIKDEYIEKNPMRGIEKVQRRRVIIDTFSMEQIEAVLAKCGKDFTGMRDRAIIYTLLDCGLRASELCGLTVDDISWTDQTMLVLGKGDKERVVPFGNTTRQVLSQYAVRRGEIDTKAFFVTCYGEPMSRYRLQQIITRKCKVAKIAAVPAAQKR